MKPIKGSQLNHLAATLKAASANPWGQAAFSSVTQQENELTLGPAATCSQTAHCSRVWAEVPGGTTGNRKHSTVLDLQKWHLPVIPAKEENHRQLISLGQPRWAPPAFEFTQAPGQCSKVETAQPHLQTRQLKVLIQSHTASERLVWYPQQTTAPK